MTNERPTRLAIIANVLTPYRLLFHRRVHEEIQEVELHTILTHGQPNQPWVFDIGDLRIAQFPISSETGHGILHHPGKSLQQALNIRSFLRKQNIDSVIINGYSDLCRISLFWMLRRDRMSIYLAGDSNLAGEQSKPPWKRKLKKLVLSWLGRHLDGVLAMGELGRAYYEEYMPGIPTFDVPCDVDIGRFRNATQASGLDAIRREGLAPSSRRLLYVGRIEHVKGVDLLIDDFMSLADSWPDWDLVVAGEGSLRQRLEAKTRERHPGRVAWLGFVAHEALPSLMKACDVLVLPSRREQWGVVVPEGLAAGIPVIAPEVSGAGAELITSPAIGRLFGQTAGTLQDALADLMRSAPLDPEAPLKKVTAWHAATDPVGTLRQLLVPGAGLRSDRGT